MSAVPTDPNILGLAYDAVGILIFGVPAVLIGSAQIAEEGGTAWDYNKHTFHRFIEQKWDTCVGSIFLIAGFAFQAIAAMNYEFVYWAGASLWLALPTFAFVYVLLRKRLFAWQLKAVLKIANSEAAQ